MSITILGSGIVGLFTAAELAMRGHKVRVLDAADEPATGASHANGGQLSYSHIEPWSVPSVLGLLAGSLFQRHSPISFHPSSQWQDWLWAMDFIWHSIRPWQVQPRMEKLWQLAQTSAAALHRIAEHYKLVFDHRASGTLHLYHHAASMRGAERLVKHMARLGCPAELLSSDDVARYEPTLAESSFAGALRLPMDEVGDAAACCHALHQALAPEVECLFKQHITRVEAFAAGWRIHTEDTVWESEKLVVALGAASAPLLKPLGVHLSIRPLAGYSLTYSLPPELIPALPSHSLTDDHAKMVASRLGNRLRIAGMGDLGPTTQQHEAMRQQSMEKWVAARFPALRQMKPIFWKGCRPATASGLPYLGQYLPGLYVNSGHGTLGWTLAAGSAETLANIL